MRTITLLTFLLFFLLQACSPQEEVPSSARLLQVDSPGPFSADPTAPDDARTEFLAALDAASRLGGVRSIVLTGDLLVATENENPPQSVDDTPANARPTLVETLAGRIAAEGFRQVFAVPDTSEPKSEPPSQLLLEPLRQSLLERGIELRDLTSCYETADATCGVDLPNSRLRLIGFPATAFATERADEARATLQGRLLARFTELIAQAALDGRKVAVVTTLAPMDLPEETRGDDNTDAKPALSWPDAGPFLDAWLAAVDQPHVVAVLSGAPRTAQRAIFDRPYTWMRSPRARAVAPKLLLAPPLSDEGQELNLLQARGVALIQASADAVKQRLYWLDPDGPSFSPATAATSLVGEDGSLPSTGKATCSLLHPGACLALLWHLADEKDPLERGTVFAIAFLLAFLTAVEIWRLPPAEAAGSSSDSNSAGAPFKSRFTQTVIAGVGGILAVTLFAELVKIESFNAKAYYVVVFTVSFFVLLVGSALFRATGEALRSRLATRYMVDAEAPAFRRILPWLFTLRAPGLVFIDTFFKVLQGDNRLESMVWRGEILHTHEQALEVVDRLREKLAEAFDAALERKTDKPIGAHEVRVSISVLQETGEGLYYVSWATGSNWVLLSRQSVAWLTAVSGRALWWKEDYEAFREPISQLLSPALREISSGKAATPETRLDDLKVGDRALGRDIHLGLRVGRKAPKSALYEQQIVANDQRTLGSFLEDAGKQLGVIAHWGRNGSFDHVTLRGDKDSKVLRASFEIRNDQGSEPFEFEGATVPAIALIDNSDGAFSELDKKRLLLKDWFQGRARDYCAFLVLPIPWSRRDRDPGARKGCLHLSFKKQEHLERLFKLRQTDVWRPDTTLSYPEYGDTRRMLEPDADVGKEPVVIRDKELRVALDLALAALGDAIQPIKDALFNDTLSARSQKRIKAQDTGTTDPSNRPGGDSTTASN